MLVNALFHLVPVTLLHLNCEKEKKEQKVLKERKEEEDSFFLFFPSRNYPSLLFSFTSFSSLFTHNKWPTSPSNLGWW